MLEDIFRQISSRSTPRLEVVEEIIYGKFLACWYIVLCVTILAYEYIITLDEEIRFIWRYGSNPKPLRISKVSIVMAINRYSPFLAYIPLLYLTVQNYGSILYGAKISDFTFNALNRMSNVFGIISQTAYLSIFTMRTHALAQGKKWISGVAIAFTVVATVLSLYCFIAEEYCRPVGTPLSEGCAVTLRSIIPAVETAIWPIIGASDLFTWVVTLYYTVKSRNQAKGFGMRITLSELLLRDGSIYFAMIALAHILGLVSYLVPNTVLVVLSLPLGEINYIPLFNSVSTVVLTSRMMFNLRAQVSDPSSLPSQASRLSAWRIAQPMVSNADVNSDLGVDSDVQYDRIPLDDAVDETPRTSISS